MHCVVLATIDEDKDIDHIFDYEQEGCYVEGEYVCDWYELGGRWDCMLLGNKILLANTDDIIANNIFPISYLKEEHIKLFYAFLLRGENDEPIYIEDEKMKYSAAELKEMFKNKYIAVLDIHQ